MERVRLTWKEVYRAGQIGLKRNIQSMMRGLEHVPPLLKPLEAWINHIEGACAELAVAVWLKIPWEATVNTFRSGYDVGKYQVRWVTERGYRLILSDKDTPGHAFILVEGRAPDYDLVGWLRATDGLKPEFLQDYGRGPAYYVPRHLMNSLDTLPDE